MINTPAQAKTSARRDVVNNAAPANDLRAAKRQVAVALRKPTKARKVTAARRPPKEAAVRRGSKTAKILDLLKRPDGATLQELMKVTGWQAHSVRGFLSGAIGKKRGIKVTSAKTQGRDRNYSVKA